MRGSSRAWPLAVVALSVAVLVYACRALGFGDGILLGVTPASGLALGAAVVLRWRGAIASAAGFALADSAWGLSVDSVAIDAGAHGLAAAVAGLAMRTLARRRRNKSKTSDWLIFLAGALAFTAVVAATYFGGVLAGVLGGSSSPMRTPLLALVFQPFGILTFGALLASLREFRLIRADPRPVFGVFAFALFLLGVLGLLLSLAPEQVSPSGVTLLLSVPFCLWVAMQRRSLDGAVLSFLASHVALVMLLHSLGSIDRAEYITAIIYLNVLVATCQLVHAVNLDRLIALAEVEARKSELEERVAKRTARLNAMTERALAADAAKTRFLATVSHEVRTPLGGIIGMANVALLGNVNDETRHHVEIIRRSGYHLLDVVNRIIDYSRLDFASLGGEVGTFDLRAMVEEVIEEVRFLPYAVGLDLKSEIEPEFRPFRRGYRQGLRQILTNLVGNASKFTSVGSVIVRVVSRPGNVVRVEVRDTGFGIAAMDLERIFLPYEQAERPNGGGHGGTGLGLAICAEMIKRMGGTIGVESTVGSGALFWFEVDLPAAKSPDDQTPAGGLAATADSTVTSTRQ